MMTNGTQNDWEVVSKIAYGWGGTKPQLIDITEPIDEIFGYDVRPRCNKYGEYAAVYSFNKKWLSILENADTEELTLGYFGETLRELGEIDTYYKKPYPLREMIRDIYCRENLEKDCIHSDTIYDFIESEFLSLAEGVNTSDMTRDDIFRLFTYSRFEADTMVINYSNMFIYSFPVLAQKTIADANFSIPYEWREGDYISLSLTKLFCPKLLEFPFYTHHHFANYDPETNTVKSGSVYNTKTKLRSKLFYAHPKLFKLLRGIYAALKSLKGNDGTGNHANDAKIFQLSEKVLMNSPTIARSKLKVSCNPQHTYIAHVASMVRVIDTLTED